MNANELIFFIALLIGVVFLVKMITSTVLTAVKAHHENRQFWGKSPDSIPPMFQKMTDKAMQERDELIDSLQDRIEVLEKIVTDQHNQSKARSLADEIDNLTK